MKGSHRWNPPLRPQLAEQLALIREKCIDCPKCVEQCAFLNEYGSPGKIAQAYDPSKMSGMTLPFECGLCGLCAAVCPVELDPREMFLEMRRESVDRGSAPLRAHKRIMAYESRGISPKYSWYSLPENCRTVFFPGCTFSGTRKDTTIAVYEYLKKRMPDLGIVLDCCCKPSHDLGRDDFFTRMFEEMKDWLTDHGVTSVIVVCPGCFTVFKSCGGPISVKSVYELLAEMDGPLPAEKTAAAVSSPQQTLSVHDACVLRNEKAVQKAVRRIAETAGFVIEEMPHSMGTTVCCGEGGSAGCVNSTFSQTWGDIRRKESGNRRLLTYCAGCAGALSKKGPTVHILDAIFYPEEIAAGKRKAARAPWTYLNRLRLKRYIRKHHPSLVTRERPFLP